MAGKTTDAEIALAEELQFVVGALVRQMRAASPAREVSLSQISILKRLDRDGSLTVADLARLDKITHQSTAVTVSALVDRGLVQRIADTHDLRRKLLSITHDGRALLAERREAGYEQIATLIATHFTPAEQQHLSHSVTLMRRLLE